MSVSTASKATTGLAEYQAILQEMTASATAPAATLRREAALLAFARRSSAQPRQTQLLLDAGNLLMEVLEADLHLVAEATGPQSLALTVRAAEDSKRLPRPLQYRGPLEPASSMAAYAIQTAAPVFSENLAREPRFADLHLRRAEAVSALAVPLLGGERTYGVLGVCQTRPRWFSEEDLRLAELMGSMLAASLVRTSLEEEQRRERAAVKAVLESLEDYVVHLDPDGKLLELNRSFQEAMQFTAEYGGRHFWKAVAADEADTVRDLLLKAVAERRGCEFDCRLLTQAGIPRQITWALRVVCDLAAKPRLVVLTGTDRTEQLRLEDELQQALQAAEQATTALHEPRTGRDAATAKAAEELPASPAAVEAPVREAAPKRPRTPQNLRSSPRRGFQYQQRIAPIIGKRLPSKWDFFEVQCHDISAGGISFYLDQRPSFNSLVVALGSAPVESFFGARVVRVVEEATPDGTPRQLVGCRFTGRVHM